MNSDRNFHKKLKEFEVDVPEFPIKKSIVNRVANWLFEPVPIPVPNFSFTGKGTVVTLFLPILITIASVIPILFL